MARVKRGVTKHARHKKVISKSKGFRGRSSNCFRLAQNRLEKAQRYAYRDRRAKKRTIRALWIQRINAAVRQHDMVYSQFMAGLKAAGVDMDRKVLSELAISAPGQFKSLIDQAQKGLKKAA